MLRPDLSSVILRPDLSPESALEEQADASLISEPALRWKEPLKREEQILRYAQDDTCETREEQILRCAQDDREGKRRDDRVGEAKGSRAVTPSVPFPRAAGVPRRCRRPRAEAIRPRRVSRFLPGCGRCWPRRRTGGCRDPRNGPLAREGPRAGRAR